MRRSRNEDEADFLYHEIVDEVRLLTYPEMKQLFPNCTVLKERAFGLTKSHIAVRRFS